MKKRNLLLMLLLFPCLLAGAQSTGKPETEWVKGTGATSGWLQVKPTIRTEKKDETPPQITFENYARETSESRITIQGRASAASGISVLMAKDKTGNGIKFVDCNQPFKTTENFKFELPLSEGMNSFVILAKNEIGIAKAETISINRRVFRKDYALIIADYQYPNSSPLDNVKNDAKNFASILRDQYKFTVDPKENLKKDEIEKLLRAYRSKKFNDGDQLLIFYGGHGSQDEYDSNIGYLKPVDGELFDHGSFLVLVNTIPCKNILLIVDACYSGLMKPEVVLSNTTGSKMRETDYKKDPDVFICEKLNDKPARNLIAAGRSTVSAGTNGHSTPLMEVILQVLGNNSGKKVIDFNDLKAELQGIKAKDPSEIGSFQKDQKEGPFIFYKKD